MSCNCSVPESFLAAQSPSLAETCGGGGYTMFMTFVELMIMSQCDISDYCRRPPETNEVFKEYDFIVVGAGTAGSVVASRLSEVPEWSVLLVEAGGYEPVGTQVPSMYWNYHGTKIDWQYQTEPQEAACLGFPNRQCTWPRGKVMGGTSTIHGMIYQRGNKKDYNNWSSLGNIGWSYDEVLPYFLKSEDNKEFDFVDQGFHARGGYLPVQKFPHHHAFSDAILEAGKEMGYQVRDLNGQFQTGFAISQVNVDNGTRVSLAKAFLRPVHDRPNLHIMHLTLASKILIDKDTKRAYGIEYIKEGVKSIVLARKEVIVSGGTVNSAQLLMLSGIGPREDLKKLNIAVIKDLKVGYNLRNHVSYSLGFTLNESATDSLTSEAVEQYLAKRTGPMSSTGLAQTTAFIHSKFSNPKADFPDLQLLFNGMIANCSKGGASDSHSSEYRRITITPVVLRTKSVGLLKLRSSNPEDSPLIYPRDLTEREDVDLLIEGVKFVIQLSRTKALRAFETTLDTTPVQHCENLEFGSDDYWECAIRYDTKSENHQVGTVKMGPPSDSSAVVNHELKVYGVQGLRVIDASIMPNIVSSNVNAPTIMIGEKGADLIKADWR